MRGSAVRSQECLVVQEQDPAGHVGARGDAPGGFSLHATVMTWVRPGSLCRSVVLLQGLHASRDLMDEEPAARCKLGPHAARYLERGRNAKAAILCASLCASPGLATQDHRSRTCYYQGTQECVSTVKGWMSLFNTPSCAKCRHGP